MIDEKPILCVKSEKKDFIWIGIFLTIVIAGAAILKGNKIVDVLLWSPLIVIVIYLVEQQIFKQFELYQDKFVIKYPWSFLYQTKIYNNKTIKTVKLRAPKGRNESMMLRIKWEENNKIKKRNHWFTMDHDKIQRLIDEIRKLNIEVEIDDEYNDFH